MSEERLEWSLRQLYIILKQLNIVPTAAFQQQVQNNEKVDINQQKFKEQSGGIFGLLIWMCVQKKLGF